MNTSPDFAIRPGSAAAYDHGTFYNGVLYPPGTTPNSALSAPLGNMYGGSPNLGSETGLPSNLDFNQLLASLGQIQPQGGDYGSGE